MATRTLPDYNRFLTRIDLRHILTLSHHHYVCISLQKNYPWSPCRSAAALALNAEHEPADKHTKKKNTIRRQLKTGRRRLHYPPIEGKEKQEELEAADTNKAIDSVERLWQTQQNSPKQHTTSNQHASFFMFSCIFHFSGYILLERVAAPV